MTMTKNDYVRDVKGRVLRFGDDDPGDRIHLFCDEREKFFSRIVRSSNGPRPLFILPKCFDFAPIVCNERSKPIIGGIRKAIRALNSASLALSFLGQGELRPKECQDILHNIALLQVGNVDAFCVVVRERFFFVQDVLPHLKNMIECAYVQLVMETQYLNL